MAFKGPVLHKWVYDSKRQSIAQNAFLICFSSANALFSDVYPIQVLRILLYFVPQTAKSIIHPASSNSHPIWQYVKLQLC